MLAWKRHIFLASLFVFSLVMSGCSSDYWDGYEDGFYDGTRVPQGSMTTLFLRDRDAYALAGVHYTCIAPDNRVTPEYVTAPDGAFSFYPGERCEFDLYGLDGTPIEPIFIEDDLGRGKGDIFYDCQSGYGGRTYGDGSFEYDIDDVCTFAL